MIKFKNYPTKSKIITSGFGPRWGTFHPGVDIAPVKPNTDGDPVVPVDDGVIVVSKIDSGNINIGYGNYYIIQHDGYHTLYGHLMDRPYKVGKTVKAGEVIGHMGHTGEVVSRSGGTGTHLHFGLYNGNFSSNTFSKSIDVSKALDPQIYLNNLEKEVIQISNPVEKEVEVMPISQEIPEWAKEAWNWSIRVGINDGVVNFPEEPMIMCYFYRYHCYLMKKLGLPIE